MQALLSAIVTVAFMGISINSTTADGNPMVALKHGGLLQGIAYTAGKQKVDHFVSEFII